jgi:periplasmic copper chaperone A
MGESHRGAEDFGILSRPAWSAFVSRALTTFASLILAFAAAFGPSFATAQTSALVVQDAWIRKPPGVDTAAVYFVLKNTSSRAVTIVGVTSPIAAHAMIHETSVAEGQSRMRAKERIRVEPGKSVAFAPEGLHVMLMGIAKNLAVGDKVPLTLQLDHAGELEVVALVRPLDAQ